MLGDMRAGLNAGSDWARGLRHRRGRDRRFAWADELQRLRQGWMLLFLGGS